MRFFVENKIPENEITENDTGKKEKSGFTGKFILAFLFTCLAAAGLFLLWAWVAYHKRYSAEFIRAGLVLVYIIPCLLGGRMLRAMAKGNAFLWGAALGACYFGAVLLLSCIIKGTAVQAAVAPLILCIISGAAGTLRRHRKKEKEQTS